MTVSLFHLAQAIRSGYGGLVIALGPGCGPLCEPADPTALAERLLALARRIDPQRIATSPRGPKRKAAKPYIVADQARAHLATARLLAKTKTTP